MSERGRSPSSTTSNSPAASPGGSPCRHPRNRSTRADSKDTKSSKSPRTVPRHRHVQRESSNEGKDGHRGSKKTRPGGRDPKKVPEKKEYFHAEGPKSPLRSRGGSQSSLKQEGLSNGEKDKQAGVGVAVSCGSDDVAALFDNPKNQQQTLKVTDDNQNKMNDSRVSQISDSGVESMDSEKLRSQVDSETNVQVEDKETSDTKTKDQSSENNMTNMAVDNSESTKEVQDESPSPPQLTGDDYEGDADEDAERDLSSADVPLEAKYDLLPCASGREFLGVLGYKRIDLLDDEKDVMASSIICTDGSDVEALSEVEDSENPLDDNENEKDSSDSIEVLDVDGKHRMTYSKSDDVLGEGSDGDGGASYPKTITKDLSRSAVTGGVGDSSDNTSPSQEDLEELADRGSPVEGEEHLPMNVELRSTEPGALLGKPGGSTAGSGLGSDSDSHIDSDTSDGGGGTAAGGGGGSGGEYLNYEDVMSQLIYGYTKMTDSGVDQFGAGGTSRPDSLCLPRPMHRRIHRSESNSSSVHSYSSTEALIEAATCTPLHAQGTVEQEGEMIAFVAQDLAEKIRMSSPLTRSSRGDNSSGASYAGGSQTPSGRSVSSVNSMSSSASGWSTSSASGWSALSTPGMSRSPSLLTQSPEDIPPIDPRAVLDLEINARRVAENLDIMMSSLKGSLNKMSAMTVNCVGAYRSGIDNTCDSVDGAIKSMYALMAKCEELSKNMKPIYRLADQIKEIKRLLDLFEAQISREEK